jgi:ribonucleoside-diphosphate reductase alpha chain
MFKQNISFEVWGGETGKYQLRNHKNEPIENTPEETCERVAKALANVEDEDNRKKWQNKFLSILGTKFAGGGRIMANVGAGQHKKETSPINCTVMRQIPDSMAGIMDVAKEAALTLKAGCGVGYDFSTIRPKGSYVYGAGAATSGIISFMKIFDSVCSTVMSGGSRRGAQMACLDVSSPEIEDFITEKRNDGSLRYFNCSVLITNAFMEAVENDQNWELWFWKKQIDKIIRDVNKDDICIIRKDDIPYNHNEYRYFSFDENHNEVVYGNCTTDSLFEKKIYKTVKAKYLFDLITKSTYNFWEPGFILIDKVNKENNLYFCETIRCTNPCVTGDTRLATDHGMITVKELFDKQLPINVTVDNRVFEDKLGTTIRQAKPIFLTAEKAEVYKVSTSWGYELKATEWHEFYTQRGKLKLKDMKVGDTLFIQSGKGQFGTKGSYELGAIIGWITGDGNFGKSDSDGTIRAFLDFWGEDELLADEMVNWINNIITKEIHLGEKNRIYRCSVMKNKNNSRIGSSILHRYLSNNFNFNENTKLRVPEIIWQGNEQCIKGYLKYLFQADGKVEVNGHNKSNYDIRLSSSYPKLLTDVQQLLANFGIVSHIYKRRDSRYKMMPDGKGGQKEYFCQTEYELVIMGNSKGIFYKEIGFFGKKQERLEDCIQRIGVGRKKERYQTKIKSIEFCGVESAYDTTQPDKNSVIFNGLVTGQCGEQPLHPLTACLLGSMILPSYVKNEFDKNVSFNFDQFAKDVRIASRLLDNVVEINNLPLEEMRKEILNKRRHGLGFTGVGSTLNMMNIIYGSQEGIDFLDKVSCVLARESLLENIELAKEKGCAPIFSSKKSRQAIINSEYMKRLLSIFDNRDFIENEIITHGLRYSHATSIAPTGTLSLTWGNNCSNGIEPVFANSYLRNVRVFNKKTKVQEEVYDYAYYLWNEKYKNKELPKHWRTTENLNVTDHLKMQAAAQKWCDSAISKTICVPENYSFEDFKNVYTEGWKLGLKGVTTYRPNASVSSGVLAQRSDLENTEYAFTTESGEEIKLKGSEFVEYDGEMHNVANLFDALKEGIYGKM